MTLSIFSGLFSNMWSILGIIFFFGGSIFVHELGHFLAAKWCGLKVERFSIGLGPRVFSWRHKGVEYCIGLLPFGGYVSLPQLGDMSLIEGKTNTDTASLPTASFNQKVIVSIAGAVFNVLFALVLATILWKVGVPKSGYQATTTIGYVEPVLHLTSKHSVEGPAYKAKLKPGDVILKVDGSAVEDFEDIRRKIIVGTGRSSDKKPQTILNVRTSEGIKDIIVYPELIETNNLSKDTLRIIGIYPAYELIVADILKGLPAEEAGIQSKDKLLSIDGEPLYSLLQLNAALADNPEKTFELTFLREGASKTIAIQPEQIPYTKPVIELSHKSIDVAEMGLLPKDPDAISSTAESSIILYTLTPEASKQFPELNLGDQIISVADQPISSLQLFLEAFKSSTSDATIKVEWRNSEGKVFTTFFNSEWAIALKPPQIQTLIGIQIESNIQLAYEPPLKQFYDSFSMTATTLKSLLQPNSDIKIHHLMGPPGIIRTLHTFSLINWKLMLWFVMVMNLNLAFLNLLPIPVLDGGHILFAVIKKIFKSFPDKWINYIQGAFVMMLIALMLYVSFFDIQRWRGDVLSEKQQALLQYYYLKSPSL